MRPLFTLLLLVFALSTTAQRRVYEVSLFGKVIGKTVVERIDRGGGTVEYNLHSHSETSILFTKKKSDIVYHVVYKFGKLFSSSYKSERDDEVEGSSITWDGAKYLIRVGTEEWEQVEAIDYSAMLMYFFEPKNQKSFFSERIAKMVQFSKAAAGIYQWKVDNGVTNIYRYRNGILYESEVSKGASVFMRLVQ